MSRTLFLMDRPHEGLLRADQDGFRLRSEDDAEMPTMFGRFAEPGEWTEIKSVVEGHFMERFSADAFVKTIKESVKKMRVLFHHGLDPFVGMAVLGPIRSLDTDTSYEVPLLDTDYNARLLPGLEAGLFGSSFKFDIVKEDLRIKPERSTHNPTGIPETTITEARVLEFGPTPLPAYTGTSAGVRSITDSFHLAYLQAEPERLTMLVDGLRAAALTEHREPPDGTPPGSVEPQHSSGNRS